MFVSSCSPSQTCMRAERGVISRSLNGLRNPRLSCCESQAVLPALRFNLRPAQVKKRLIKRVGLPGGSVAELLRGEILVKFKDVQTCF